MSISSGSILFLESILANVLAFVVGIIVGMALFMFSLKKGYPETYRMLNKEVAMNNEKIV